MFKHLIITLPFFISNSFATLPSGPLPQACKVTSNAVGPFHVLERTVYYQLDRNACVYEPYRYSISNNEVFASCNQTLRLNGVDPSDGEVKCEVYHPFSRPVPPPRVGCRFPTTKTEVQNIRVSFTYSPENTSNLRCRKIETCILENDFTQEEYSLVTEWYNYYQCSE